MSNAQIYFKLRHTKVQQKGSFFRLVEPRGVKTPIHYTWVMPTDASNYVIPRFNKREVFALDGTLWCKNTNSLHMSNAHRCFKLRHTKVQQKGSSLRLVEPRGVKTPIIYTWVMPRVFQTTSYHVSTTVQLQRTPVNLATNTLTSSIMYGYFLLCSYNLFDTCVIFLHAAADIVDTVETT